MSDGRIHAKRQYTHRLGAARNPRKGTMTNRRVSVFGPAYLDRVLRVDQPLIDPALGPPLDQSVDGTWKFGANRSLELADPAGYAIEVELPVDWPGPTGSIRLARPIRLASQAGARCRGLSWHDDLGRNGSRLRGRARRPAPQRPGIGVRPHEPGDLASSGRSWHFSRADSRVRSPRRLDLAHHQRPVRR